MYLLTNLVYSFDVDGYVTGFGNPDWARTHSAATSTAPAVLAVLKAGATSIGKTVMDEMAYRFNFKQIFIVFVLFDKTHNCGFIFLVGFENLT